VARSAIANGRDLLRAALDLSLGETDVVITYTDEAGRVSGRVVEPNVGASRDQFVVVMLPKDYRSRLALKVPAMRLARISATSASRNYIFLDVVPGDYLIAATSASVVPPEIDHQFLDSLARVAHSIAIGQGKDVRLDLPVERGLRKAH
jgi:hypothetical protein